MHECGFGEAKGFLRRSSFIPPIYGVSRVTCAACGPPERLRGLGERSLLSHRSPQFRCGVERARVCSQSRLPDYRLPSLPLNILLCGILDVKTPGRTVLIRSACSLFIFKDIFKQGVQDVPFLKEANVLTFLNFCGYVASALIWINNKTRDSCLEHKPNVSHVEVY